MAKKIQVRSSNKKDSLSINLNRAFDSMKKGMRHHVAKVLEEGFDQLVRETPRDTGYAQNNWRVVAGNVKSEAPKEKDPKREYPSADSVIKNYQIQFTYIRKNGFDLGMKFYNRTPYIYVLEYSHKSQSYFARRAVEKMRMGIESKMVKI